MLQKPTPADVSSVESVIVQLSIKSVNQGNRKEYGGNCLAEGWGALLLLLLPYC